MWINCKTNKKTIIFFGDYSIIYSKNTLFVFKEYLEKKNIYLKEIKSLDCQKRIEKRILEKLWENQKFRLDKSNENKEWIVLYKNWNWNKKETIKNRQERRSRSLLLK